MRELTGKRSYERGGRRMTVKMIMWQYCHDLNDINDAICGNLYGRETDWEGLESASQIKSITYDSNHGCYVVFWEKG